MGESLLNGGDTARIFAFDNINYLFRQMKFFFLRNFAVFNDIDSNIVIDKA